MTNFAQLIRAASLALLICPIGLAANPSLPQVPQPTLTSDSATANDSVFTLKPDMKMRRIAKLVSQFMSEMHYSRTPIDDSLSKKLFNEYLNSLDPSRIYFTAPEIENLRATYEARLDQDLNRGNLSYPYEAYALFSKHLLEYNVYCEKAIDTITTFDSNDEIELDRKKSPWPKDSAEMQDLWRKRITNELLSMRLVQRAKIQDLEKKSAELTKSGSDTAKPKAEHNSWNERSPQERVKRRLKQYLKHYSSLKPLDVLEVYLNSLTTTFDPHSNYMTPKTEEEFNIHMELQLVGVGAELNSEDGYVRVSKVIPGGPAARDGRLKAGDRIISVIQENNPTPIDLQDIPLDQAVSHIRGEINSKVTLVVLDGTQGITALPKNIDLVRDRIIVTDEEAKGEVRVVKDAVGVERKIGIITLPVFYFDFKNEAKNSKNKCAYEDVKRILADLKSQKIEGLVFDLRNNGGGALIDAIRISGLFIKYGPVVQIKNYIGGVAVQKDEDPSLAYDGPMIVMVNRLSASASEIFAAAMQDYKRAVIVGDRQTHGKGTVQDVRDLSEFASRFSIPPPAGTVKYTTAKFYRVNGDSTQLRGIRPDIVFPSFTDMMDDMGEAKLENALPFDTVPVVTYESTEQVSPEKLSALREKSTARTASKTQFNALNEQIKIFGQIRDMKTLSLNEEKRWSEFIRERDIIEKQAKLLRLDKESDNADDPKKALPDIYLEETVDIMSDFLALPAKTK